MTDNSAWSDPANWARMQVADILETGTTQGIEVQGMPIVLLTMRGAKSGKVRRTPVMRVEHNGRYAVVASKSGAPEHPEWYRNITDHPEIQLQDGSRTRTFIAREVDGDERAAWWDIAVAAYPPYADYQTKTDRTIPVLVLEDPPGRGAADGIDLRAYLTRIGLTGTPTSDAEGLRAIHRAHVHAIPFENVRALEGSAPSLSVPDLEDKLLRQPRGGYCYEHNSLLAAALKALGYGVTGLAARVRVGARGAIRPRTHMLLLVDVPGDGRQYIADAGFGIAGALVEAIPLTAGTEAVSGGRHHRLVREPHPGPRDLWVLQFLQDGTWSDQYAFTTEPFEAADVEVFNWHMATNPRSPFHRTLFAYRTGPDTDLALVGRTLTTTSADGTRHTRDLTGPAEVHEVLASRFGIDLPARTQNVL